MGNSIQDLPKAYDGLLSVIVPCKSEAQALPIFYAEFLRVMKEMGNPDFELIFVEDGSTDNTLEILRTMSKEDARVRYISFSRNFGKEAAMCAGMKYSAGDYLTIMDADLQDPPSLLPQMFAKMKETGCDCVATRRKNREGDPIRPFTTSCFACDTGLPNSDGSISENSNTWRETVDKLLSENIALDYRWFDAGWYSDPDGNTVSTDWFGTVGSWTIDRAKWGEDGFAKSVRYCRSHGIKTLAWFEPERVSHTDALEKNFGYDRRWAIDCGKGALWNNIGDPDCLKWTTNRIVTFLRENDVDMYREDFNIDPKPYWDAADCADAVTYGLPRAGITENKGVCAHYALWDAIIADMAERGKDTFVDCCASGGGRNDILSLRRGIPLLRSDADRTTLNLRLSMTTSFNAWIPFCGSSTKETARQEEVSAGADDYAFRASFLPVMNLTECWSKNKSLDYDAVRRSIDEWKSINDLLLKDVYFLTPWQNRLDDAGITALAYFDDQNGKGVVLAFRKENCERDSVTVKLPFAGNDEKYVMRGENLPETTISGKTAAEGLALRLPDKRTSALVYLERIRP